MITQVGEKEKVMASGQHNDDPPSEWLEKNDECQCYYIL